ncbi:MAG: ribonuclease P protein component [Cyclobacteriaceae bacterium]|jgi:ribonuclease P protein component|nr:ribonuclease P protein component [Cyclobacteriaceae bacterium]
MGTYSFPKSERIHKQIAIQELFKRGSSFYLHPFKVLYLPLPESALCHQVMVSVSKRSFKKAVDRNLIKRRIREAYRLNRQQLAGMSKYQIVYIYTAREVLDYQQIEDKIISSFRRLEAYGQKN